MNLCQITLNPIISYQRDDIVSKINPISFKNDDTCVHMCLIKTLLISIVFFSTAGALVVITVKGVSTPLQSPIIQSHILLQTVSTVIARCYLHLRWYFIVKEDLDILPPDNSASAISRQGRIGQDHLQYSHIASSSTEFLGHSLNCTSSTGTRQTRLRMRCEEKFSYSHRILPGQGLSRHCSISTIFPSGQGEPP